jgi:hypothetical protein
MRDDLERTDAALVIELIVTPEHRRPRHRKARQHQLIVQLVHETQLVHLRHALFQPPEREEGDHLALGLHSDKGVDALIANHQVVILVSADGKEPSLEKALDALFGDFALAQKVAHCRASLYIIGVRMCGTCMTHGRAPPCPLERCHSAGPITCLKPLAAVMGRPGAWRYSRSKRKNRTR